MDKGTEGGHKKSAEGYTIHHDYSKCTDQDGQRTRYFLKEDRTLVLFPWEPVRTKDGGCIFRNPKTEKWSTEDPGASSPEAPKQSKAPAPTPYQLPIHGSAQQYQQQQQQYLYNAAVQHHQAQMAAAYNHRMQQAQYHSPRIYNAPPPPPAWGAPGTSSGLPNRLEEVSSSEEEEPRNVPTRKSSTPRKSHRQPKSQSPPLLLEASRGHEHKDVPTKKQLRIGAPSEHGGENGGRKPRRPTRGEDDREHPKQRPSESPRPPAAPEAPPLGGGVGREGYRTQWLEDKQVAKERKEQEKDDKKFMAERRRRSDLRKQGLPVT